MNVSPDELFSLFLKPWSEQGVRVKAFGDGRCFNAIIEGFIFEGNGRIWISPSAEQARDASFGLTFLMDKVRTSEYGEPREAPLEDRAFVEAEMVSGLMIELVSRERIWIYQLP